MLKNMSGTQMDYETFKAEYDAIPQLQNLVDRFDGEGITLKTRKKPEATRTGNEPTDLGQGASRAAAKMLKKPG